MTTTIKCRGCGIALEAEESNSQLLGAQRWKAQALKALEAGNYEEAAEGFERTLRTLKSDHECYAGLVRCELGQAPLEKYDRESPNFTRALRHAPTREVKDGYNAEVENHEHTRQSAQTACVVYGLAFLCTVLLVVALLLRQPPFIACSMLFTAVGWVVYAAYAHQSDGKHKLALQRGLDRMLNGSGRRGV